MFYNAPEYTGPGDAIQKLAEASRRLRTKHTDVIPKRLDCHESRHPGGGGGNTLLT
jgi:hypothetical protein